MGDKTWQEILARMEAEGRIPEVSSGDDFDEAVAAASRDLADLRGPAHAKVEDISFHGRDEVSLRVLVDQSELGLDVGALSLPMALSELTVNGVHLKDPKLLELHRNETRPDKIEVVLHGSAEGKEALSVLRSLPLSVDARLGDGFALKGFEVRRPG